MDFGNAFIFQFTDKRLHITIKGFLGKHILKSKAAAFFHNAQCLADYIALVFCKMHFMENKIADHRIKGLIRERQMRRISLLKLYPIFYALNFSIFLTLLLSRFLPVRSRNA